MMRFKTAAAAAGQVTLLAFGLSVGTSALAQSLAPGIECALRKPAALFEATRGPAKKRILPGKTSLTVMKVEARRSKVRLSESEEGFVRTRRLRRVCRFSEPVSQEASAEAETSSQTASSSDGASPATLCTTQKSVSLFSDTELRQKLRIALAQETFIVLDQKERAWTLIPDHDDLESKTQNEKHLFAKAKRLSAVCTISTKTLPLPETQSPSAVEPPILAQVAEPQDETINTDQPTQSTETNKADSEAPLATPASQQSTAAESRPAPSVPVEPSKDVDDQLAKADPFERVDLIGDRYWLERRRRIAVRDVAVGGSNFPDLLEESLSSVIASELQARSRNRFDVLSRGDLRKLIAQKTEAQMMGCVSDNCMLGLAEAADADNILTSSVERLGESTVLTLELFDVEQQRVMRRQAVAWRGDDAGLIDLARAYLTWVIEGPAATDLRGTLQVIADPEHAQAIIDGQDAGKTPLTLVPNLPIGIHELRLSKSGYLPYDEPFVIQANETTLLQLTMVSEDALRPWYKSWWTWSGAALIGGGITSAALINQGFGAEQPICLSACVQEPWYQNGWSIAGLALGALSVGASAYIAWNWDEVLEWIESWDEPELPQQSPAANDTAIMYRKPAGEIDL